MRLSDRARDRLERWADRMDTINVIVQLIAGVILVTLVDVDFVIKWRQGYRYPGPPILTLLAPVLVTSGWLLLASFLVRWAYFQPNQPNAATQHTQDAQHAQDAQDPQPAAPVVAPTDAAPTDATVTPVDAAVD